MWPGAFVARGLACYDKYVSTHVGVLPALCTVSPDYTPCHYVATKLRDSFDELICDIFIHVWFVSCQFSRYNV